MIHLHILNISFTNYTNCVFVLVQGVLSGPINIIGSHANILPGQTVITNQQGNVSLTSGGQVTTGISPARFAQLMTMGLSNANKNQQGGIRAATSQNQLSLLQVG